MTIAIEDVRDWRRHDSPPPRLRLNAVGRAGIWGPPRDREGALETLRRVPKLGINLIDTADSYGPDVAEPLIREALFPYAAGLRIATKAGLRRTGPDQWRPHGDPDYLIAQAKRSRELLKVDRIDLWQLHRIDPAVPAGEQFAAIRQLLDTGVIRHAGLAKSTSRKSRRPSGSSPLRPFRTATILRTARARTCSTIVRRTGSGSFRGFRLRPVD